jgi:glyoxylase-like metal-dependent hydrolase (beta-lactamase superfamily II)/rhodanese-related sulfurtransferase
MKPIQLFDAASGTYTYVLFDEVSTVSPRPALIIDPVDAQLERDLAILRQYDLKLVWALETHAHADHITSAGLLAEHMGAQTAAPEACGISTASRLLVNGDVLSFGSQHVTALHTPGHTAGSMSFVWKTSEASEDQHVFTGDTLLIGGCGRTDFQSGSATALYNSITQVLFALPDSAIVWPGHDYKGNKQSTIGAEKTSNARVAGRSLDEFVALMEQLKLPKPKRIDEAVPANLRSGLTASVAQIWHDAREKGDNQTPLNMKDTSMTQDAVQAVVVEADGYAGDITPQTAFVWWQAGEAVLVDIRTDAERAWVGFVPGAAEVAWKQWPGMVMNPAYDADLMAAVPAGKKVLLLCRSGLRSIPAAKRAAELGLEAYNILEGFEGDPNGDAHRNRVAGWRYRGLPWRQN